MILKKLLGPADLTRAQVLHIYKLTEVIIVNKEENLILAVFQLVIPSLKDFNNSRELLIVNLVASFDGDYFLKKKTTRYYWLILDLRKLE